MKQPLPSYLAHRPGLLVLMLSFGLSVGVACTEEADKAAGSKQKIVPVETMTVTGQMFHEYGEFLAELRGTQQATLIAHKGGRVYKVLSNPGQEVKTGEQLCDAEGALAATARQAANLSASIALQTLERRRQALKVNTVAKLNVDQAQAQYLAAREAQIQAEKAYQGAYCISPINGTVIEKLIEPWQFLAPGAPTFVIADYAQIRATIGIPESEISGYEVGNKISLSLASHPGRVWEGTIASLSLGVNETRRTFRAEAIIDNRDKVLLPGLTARLKVERYHLKEQKVIPRASVLTEGQQQYVYTVKEGVAHKKPVVLFSANKDVAVVASGLEMGEELIISGQLLAGEGAQVDIINAASKAPENPQDKGAAHD